MLATCRQQKDCERLTAQGLESFVLDYACSDSVQTGAQRALELTNGRVDALFNNGAYAIPGLVEDLPREALRTLFDTNFFGQFELIRALIPSMRDNAQGRIINCSSVLGFAALPFRGAYNASKFAMEGLSDTLRLEMADTPIHVSLIEPGPIATRIRQNSVAHFEQWIDWENAARREDYETKLRPRLYDTSSKKDRFELLPEAVTNKLIHALEHRNPKPRYYVTTPTYIAGTLKRILSTRLLDKVLSR